MARVTIGRVTLTLMTPGTLALPLNSWWGYLQSVRKTSSLCRCVLGVPEEWLMRGSLAPTYFKQWHAGSDVCVGVCGRDRLWTVISKAQLTSLCVQSVHIRGFIFKKKNVLRLSARNCWRVKYCGIYKTQLKWCLAKPPNPVKDRMRTWVRKSFLLIKIGWGHVGDWLFF